jgi:hypothetical protein
MRPSEPRRRYDCHSPLKHTAISSHKNDMIQRPLGAGLVGTIERRPVFLSAQLPSKFAREIKTI